MLSKGKRYYKIFGQEIIDEKIVQQGSTLL